MEVRDLCLFMDSHEILHTGHLNQQTLLFYGFGDCRSVTQVSSVWVSGLSWLADGYLPILCSVWPSLCALVFLILLLQRDTRSKTVPPCVLLGSVTSPDAVLLEGTGGLSSSIGT